MDLKRLKAEMLYQNKNYKDLAKVIGVSTTTANNKMNGISLFTCEECDKIISWLELDIDIALAIFLPSLSRLMGK